MIQLAIDPAVPAQPAPGPRIVSPAHFVANALTVDPEDPTTLEQWAARLRVSVAVLEQDFRREFGATFSEVQVLLRHSAAAALLDARLGLDAAAADHGPYSSAEPAPPATPWSALSPESPRTPW